MTPQGYKNLEKYPPAYSTPVLQHKAVVSKTRISGLFGIENYSWKVCIILRYLWILLIFVFHFLCQTVSIPPDQNVSIPSDQNVSTPLGSNMYNENIGTFWHRTLCMKASCSWKSLGILLTFLDDFGAQNVPISPTHILLRESNCTFFNWFTFILFFSFLKLE